MNPLGISGSGNADSGNADSAITYFGEDTLEIVCEDGTEIVVPLSADGADHSELVDVEEALAEEDGGEDG